MSESYTFLKDDVALKLLGKLEAVILENDKEGKETLARKRKLWRIHCILMRLPLLDIHTEVTPKDGKLTYFAAGKEGTLIMGARPDKRPICGQDYFSFMPNDKENVLISDDKDIEDEDICTISTLWKKGKGIPLSRKNISESSNVATEDASKVLDLPAP
ncbi:hypothetical protein ACOSP7_024270 [Xanthoceras sorbifolium]